MDYTTLKFASMIDHTLLKPEATFDQIKRLCQEALKFQFCSVCINPWWVKRVKPLLLGSKVKICTVIGFPLGMTGVKALEGEQAVKEGAHELDMVLAIGALKDKNYPAVLTDIKSVVALGVPVKVILETCLLTDEEIMIACDLCMEAEAAFVKTSTGFSTLGATVEHVRLMKDCVKTRCKVKASGGVRTLEDFQKMVEAGADRIGTSGSVKIIESIKQI